MSFVPSITIDNVIVAVSDFLEIIMPAGTTVFRTQSNRVAMPKGQCVAITELFQIDLSTTVIDYLPDNVITYSRSVRQDVQIDFYGENAGDMCSTAKIMLRSPFGPDNFPDGIKPLYCDDGRQTPLITGEEQYEYRWTITLSLQYNPVITTVVEEQFDTLGDVFVQAVDTELEGIIL